MALSIRKITPEATHPLRQQLLRQQVPLDALIYSGDNEPIAFHVGAFWDGEQVGIASVLHQPPSASKGTPENHPDPDHLDAWRLRGMATTDAVRGHGIGTQMLLACVGYVATQRGALLWCDSRVGARAFYERNGFVVLGDGYDVPDVGPHFFMQRTIVPADVVLLGQHLES